MKNKNIIITYIKREKRIWGNNKVEGELPKMNEAKKTLKEIIAGILFMAFIESVIGAIISGYPVNFILGEVLGTIGAVAFMLDLYKSIDKTLSLDEVSAVKYSKKRAVIRMILLAAVIFISFLLMEYVSVLGAFLGLMNIKFGVYLVPIGHKYKSMRDNNN